MVEQIYFYDSFFWIFYSLTLFIIINLFANKYQPYSINEVIIIKLRGHSRLACGCSGPLPSSRSSGITLAPAVRGSLNREMRTLVDILEGEGRGGADVDADVLQVFTLQGSNGSL
jgi:hypothetical protein